MSSEADPFNLPADVRAALAERICVSSNSSAVIALLGWLEIPAPPSLIEAVQWVVWDAFKEAPAGASRGDLLLDSAFQELRKRGLKPGWDARRRFGPQSAPTSRFDREPLV